MKKLISLLLILIFVFPATSLSAATEIDALQKFFVYSISLDGDSRVALVDTIKDIRVETDVTETKKHSAAALLPDMTAEEVAEALKIYSQRSVKNQDSIRDIILFGAKEIPYAENMPTIVSEFNTLIIGSPTDSRGVTYFHTLLAIYSMFSLFDGDPYIAKNHTLPGLIDLYVSENVSSEAVKNITGALGYMPALKSQIDSCPGVNLMDKLFSYAEDLVNGCDSNEIYYFKSALKKLGVFEGAVSSSSNVKYEGLTFRDLDSFGWASHQIRVLSGEGVINGINKYEFAPSSNVTREQFVKMIVEAFDISSSELTLQFADTPADAWYYPYIQSAFGAGIVNGISETDFGVGMPITREQMATMVFRVCEFKNISLSDEKTAFSDNADISSWATDAVGSMAGAGIINGMGDGTFAPKSYANRAQAAVLIYNAMKFALLI